MFTTVIPMIKFHDMELTIHLMARTVPDHPGHPVLHESSEDAPPAAASGIALGDTIFHRRGPRLPLTSRRRNVSLVYTVIVNFHNMEWNIGCTENHRQHRKA
jgi:hypothetical protein